MAEKTNTGRDKGKKTEVKGEDNQRSSTPFDLFATKKDEKGRIIYKFTPKMTPERRHYKHSLAEQDIERRIKALNKYVGISLNINNDRISLLNQYKVLVNTLIAKGIITRDDMTDIEHILIDNRICDIEKNKDRVKSKILQAKLTMGIRGPDGKPVRPIIGPDRKVMG